MADIRRYPLLHHFRCGPTDHVVYLRRGKVVRSGTGLSFWFRPLSAALSEVPVADRELPLLFHARTADMQDVTVRAAVAFRFEDPALAARRLDFGIDPGTGTWRASPLENVAATLTALSQQHALDVVGTLSLREVLAGGVALVRERVAAGLADGSRLRDVGIVVSAVQIIAIRPEPDAERALETPALELIHQEADRARFERRALAVERERAISENELQSQIELATREEQLVAQRGANERRRAGEEAAAGRIKNESDAERTRLLAAAKADSTRLVGAAEAEAESQRLDAYARLDRDVLLALAARELAGHLPEIGSITVTPDLLASALARLGGPAAANGSAEAAGGSGGRR